ncbi:MAG TPA: Flp family type IVb pilin [Bosea sp. (in: a-proteobacteria)]
MTTIFASFVRDERGATALEYGFIAALMSVATIAVIAQIGVNVNDLTSRVLTGFR